MFARRKKNYRVFVVTALIVSICILIVAILWPTEPNYTDEKINVNAQTKVEDNKEDVINEKPDTLTDNKDSDTVSKNKTYYIVKKSGDAISVFFITEDGKQIKLEDTEIIYDLLPQEDQRNFDVGIVLEEQEQLSSLLQDFEG